MNGHVQVLQNAGSAISECGDQWLRNFQTMPLLVLAKIDLLKCLFLIFDEKQKMI